MTELKTLKDLPISPLRKPKGTELAYLDWFKEQLKAEAIKWVKEYENSLEDARGMKLYEFEDKILGIIGFIITFFNLTEEDLGEKSE
jgi:hypothetical protein